jgi:hypothetical protein
VETNVDDNKPITEKVTDAITTVADTITGAVADVMDASGKVLQPTTKPADPPRPILKHPALGLAVKKPTKASPKKTRRSAVKKYAAAKMKVKKKSTKKVAKRTAKKSDNKNKKKRL